MHSALARFAIKGARGAGEIEAEVQKREVEGGRERQRE